MLPVRRLMIAAVLSVAAFVCTFAAEEHTLLSNTPNMGPVEAYVPSHIVPDSLPELPQDLTSVPRTEFDSFRFAEKRKHTSTHTHKHQHKASFPPIPLVNLHHDPLGCGLKPLSVPACMQQVGSPCLIDEKAKAILQEEAHKKATVWHLNCVHNTLAQQKQQAESLDAAASQIRSQYVQALYQRELLRTSMNTLQENLKKLTDLDNQDLKKLEDQSQIEFKKELELQKQNEEAEKKNKEQVLQLHKQHIEALKEQTTKAEEYAKKETQEQQTKKDELAKQNPPPQSQSSQSSQSSQQSSQSQSSQSAPAPTRSMIKDAVVAKLLPSHQPPLNLPVEAGLPPQIVDTLGGGDNRRSSSPISEDDSVEADAKIDRDDANHIKIHIHDFAADKSGSESEQQK